MRIIEYLKLMRLHQWYKNVLIFLPLFFAGRILDFNLFEHALLGFMVLCFVSSTNYILNDIIDIKRDKNHPEKKYRPLASGTVSVIEGIILATILLSIAIIVALMQNIHFFGAILLLFLLTLAYSLKLKDEPVLDIILLSINFIIRILSGALLLSIYISPWLVVVPFFLALLLATGKRGADLRLLKEEATNHKKVLAHYTHNIINGLMLVSTTCLIIAYSLYAFSRTELLLITLPFVVYTSFRYYLLVNQGSEIARAPEKVFKDYRMMTAIFLWIITTFVILYL